MLFEEAFGYGCPKFITASPPAFDNPTAAAPQEVSLGGGEGVNRSSNLHGTVAAAAAAAVVLLCLYLFCMAMPASLDCAPSTC